MAEEEEATAAAEEETKKLLEKKVKSKKAAHDAREEVEGKTANQVFQEFDKGKEPANDMVETLVKETVHCRVTQSFR